VRQSAVDARDFGGVVDFPDPAPTRVLLRYLLANDVARLYPGKALYTCLLNQAGGVIDDLIVYDRGESGYRLVLNAATRDKDLAWIAPIAERFNAAWQARDDLAMLAVQGPEALAKLDAVLDPETAAAVRTSSRFHAVESHGLFIARTGYTGEDGVEILPPVADAPVLWDRLLAAGVAPCGLGARDTLRLEAGMSGPPVSHKPLSAWCWKRVASCAATKRFTTVIAKSG
jgi:aminomethyltransferase